MGECAGAVAIPVVVAGNGVVVLDDPETSVAKHLALLQACMAGLGQANVRKELKRLARLMIVCRIYVHALFGLHVNFMFDHELLTHVPSLSCQDLTTTGCLRCLRYLEVLI